MKTPLPLYSPGINIAVIRRIGDDWQFLLLERSGEDPAYGGFWGLLSGTRDNNETVTELALREMQEEIGLQPNNLYASEYCLQFFEPTRDSVWVLPVLVATIDAGAEIRLDSENSEFRWLPCDEAMKLARWRNLRDVIRKIAEDLAAFPPPNWMEMPLP